MKTLSEAIAAAGLDEASEIRNFKRRMRARLTRNCETRLFPETKEGATVSTAEYVGLYERLNNMTASEPATKLPKRVKTTCGSTYDTQARRSWNDR